MIKKKTAHWCYHDSKFSNGYDYALQFLQQFVFGRFALLHADDRMMYYCIDGGNIEM